MTSDKVDLHISAIELRVALRDAKPNSLGIVRTKGTGARGIPDVEISMPQIDRVTKLFHAIIVALERDGILYRDSRSAWRPGCFIKSDEWVYLKIDEETEYRNLQGEKSTYYGETRNLVLTGKLEFEIRYRGDNRKHLLTERENMTFDSLVAEVGEEIRKHYADTEKERARWEELQRIADEKRAAEEKIERQQRHKETLQKTHQERISALFKAAELHCVHQTTIDFINECEKRWRTAQGGSLTAEQETWLTWARDTADAKSPFKSGYPEPAIDGAFDAGAVPFGGPYPPTRNFKLGCP